MKNIFLSAIACVLFCVGARAQNVPAGGGPTGSPTLVTPPAAFTPVTRNGTSYYNFRRTYTPQLPTTNAGDAQFQFATNWSGLRSVYMNGWGQVIETINRGYEDDIVVPGDNRPSLTRTSFLPYVSTVETKFQTNAFVDQRGYYNNAYPDEGGVGYTQTVATSPTTGDPSQAAPTPTVSAYSAGLAFGQDGSGATAVATSTLSVNDPSQSDAYYVPLFILDVNNQPSSVQYYPYSSLVAKHTVGQHGREVYSFYDMNSRLVCRKQSNEGAWLTTCYVYNDFGQLAAIVPPKACTLLQTVALPALPYPVSADIIAGLCYTYVYDMNGHMVQRHVPGETGVERIVYDRNERPVLFQSALLNQQGEWKFIVYDTKDRPVMTGLINSTVGQETWQGMMASSAPQQDPLVNYIINGYSGGGYPQQHYGSGTILTYNYYDNYTLDPQIAAAATFDASFVSDYSVSDPTPAAYLNTKGMLTATKVFNDPSLPNQWTTSINFYDQAGHLIQTKTSGAFTTPNQWDTHTVQYNFSGNVVRDILQHYIRTGAKPSTKVVKQYNYDVNNGGRLVSEYQKLDADVLRLIASYTYDNLGRVSQKSLGGVEVQNYTYNIRGQLTGINPTYAQETPVDLPDVTFGCNLNYDYGFSQGRNDGKVSGMTWRGAGVGAPLRAYGYNYDDLGRLVGADFRELVNIGVQTWNSQGVSDFTMSNVTYDDNGNILSMNQMGNTPNGAIPIDQLTYQYEPNSNRLVSVGDHVTANYNLGDFIDGNTNGADYAYDGDGNLTQDLNKGISSIAYNYQDLPTQITQTQGSVNNIYDANGTLVSRTVVQNGTSTQYWYAGPFVYVNQALSYMTTEEGRCRWVADSSLFKYDFFVKDHLGNVRTVLTSDAYGSIVDQAPPESYMATYEIAAANIEGASFNNVGTVATANPDPSSNDMQAAMLNGADADRQVGTSIMLHVMAGDKFDVGAMGYWVDSAKEQVYAEPENILSSLISTLAGGVGGTGAAGDASSGYINAMNNSLVTNFKDYQSIFDAATVPNTPHAYVNYLVFDENMNLIPAQSGAVQISSIPGSWQYIGTAAPISLSQNGFVAVYISNAQYQDVYFNNFNVILYHGRLLEEQHYYPFGLAVKDGGQNNTPLPNKFLCESNELNDELGINLYDFNARQYDAQIGRFTGLDPLGDELGQEGLSPYHFCANDPANHTDPTGLAGGDKPTTGNTSPDGGTGGGEVSQNINTMPGGGGGQGDGGYGETGADLMSIAMSFYTYTTPSVPTLLPISNNTTNTVANTTATAGISETNQDVACMVPSGSSAPQATPPTPGDEAATNTGTFGVVVISDVTAAANAVSSTVHGWAQTPVAQTATAIVSVALQMGLNSIKNSITHFSLADISIGGGPIGLAEEGMDALGMGTKAMEGGETGFIHGAGTDIGSVTDGIIHDLDPTLKRIEAGEAFPHRNDGSIFRNKEGLLPQKDLGYYREFVHPTPGVKGPGPMRVITGKNGEIWFTPDHYQTFTQIK